jgi:hypothetical protein
MTLSLAIVINVLADLGLIGGLAYTMSRAARLSAHVTATDAPAAEPIYVKTPRPARRTSSALAPATS